MPQNFGQFVAWVVGGGWWVVGGAVSVVVSQRRGSQRESPSQSSESSNVLPEASAIHTRPQPQPQPCFLHANDDLTSEIRYTARGRFMTCLPCTFPPQQRCQSTNNLLYLVPIIFTLISSPNATRRGRKGRRFNVIAARGQQKLMLESGVCGPALRWAWL